MTVMIDRFLGMPQSAVRLGKLRNLSGMALRLYVALWHESERYSTREITRTTAELKTLVGGARNSHSKARSELVKAGLVEAEPCGAEGFIFHLCNPETGKPWPQNPKERVVYRKKNEKSPAAQTVAAPGFTKPPKIASAGTSFDYGFNSHPPAEANLISAVPIKPTALRWEDTGN